MECKDQRHWFLNSATTKFGLPVSEIAVLPSLAAVPGLTDEEALQHGLNRWRGTSAEKEEQRKQKANERKRRKEAERAARVESGSSSDSD